MQAICTVDDVLGWFEEEPTAGLRRIIATASEYASDRARELGAPTWLDAEKTPARIRRLVAAAVARWAKNPDGLNTSRAADETLVWQENLHPGVVWFTPDEEAILRRHRPAMLPTSGSVLVSNGLRPGGMARSLFEYRRRPGQFRQGGWR